MAGALTAGGAILLVIGLWSWARKIAIERRGGGRTALSEPPRRPRSVDPILPEAEELAERLAARLDEKADRLERLIAQADERIDRLSPSDRSPRSGHHLGRPSGGGGGGGGGAGTGGASRMIEPRPGAAAQSGARADLFASDEIDPLTRQIFRLSDEGLKPLDIAQRLDEQVGKVELILALRDA